MATEKRKRGRPPKKAKDVSSNSVKDFNDEIDSHEGAERLERLRAEEAQNELNKKINEPTIQKMEAEVIEPIEESKEAFDPFDRDVIERAYTSGNNESATPTADSGLDFPEADFITGVEDVPITEATPASGTATPSAEETATPFSGTPPPPPKPEGGSSSSTPNTESTPAEKKRNAEKLADTLLAGYGSMFPKPFKYMAKFNMNKAKKMELNDEFRLGMVVTEDGQTIGGYMENVNGQVDETFTITEEMKAEIKDPLVDVLLENGLELTPTQRLLIAVSGQVATFGISAFAQYRQNKDALDQFREFHDNYRKDNPAQSFRPFVPNEGGSNVPPPPPAPQQQPEQNQPSETEELINANKELFTDKEVLEPDVETVEDSEEVMDLDSYLETDDNSNEEFDIPQ